MTAPNPEADRIRAVANDAAMNPAGNATRPTDREVPTPRYDAQPADAAGERAQLEQQWDRGDNVSTEDLRVALQRYRSFFSRLLTL
jgi:hypothetical protein